MELFNTWAFDVIVATLVLFSAFFGFGHGFWRSAASLISAAIATVAMVIFSEPAQSWLAGFIPWDSVSNPFAHAGVFFGVFLLARLVLGGIAGLIRRGRAPTIAARFGGLVLGALRGGFFALAVFLFVDAIYAPAWLYNGRSTFVFEEIAYRVQNALEPRMRDLPAPDVSEGPADPLAPSDAEVDVEPVEDARTPDLGADDFVILGDRDVALSSNDACNVAASASASASNPRHGFVCVPVMYGTNRTPDPGGGENRFGPRLAADGETCISEEVCNVSLGVATVTVPRRREGAAGSPIKTLRSPTAIATDRDRANKFTLWDIDPLDDPTAFAAVARGYLEDAEDFENQAFVFVHGFNMEFRDAAFRTAQIAFDTGFDGPTFFFSWPANGDVLDYLSDQDDADVSVDELMAFLRLVRLSVEPDTRIHLIAHSMGTRLTAQTLARLDDQGFFDTHRGFDVVVFAAGDLDAKLFREWVGRDIDAMAENVTLFASKRDVAVATSNVLRQISSMWKDSVSDPKERIGLADEFRGPSVFPDMTTIDLTAAGEPGILGFRDFNHDDYVGDAELMADLACQFQGDDRAPSDRSPKFVRAVRPDAEIYWRYEPRTDGEAACPPDPE